MIDFEERLEKFLKKIKNFLIEKNSRYGSSVFEPINIFSDLSPLDGIKIRIDDKLKRIKNLKKFSDFDEDTLLDLIGYLIILKIFLDKNKEK